MFDRVLIANRGEIAVRIIRTLHRLGVQSIAVYSEADADALHVHEAGRALCIGPAAASQSYLSVERIIDAAVRSGAQAIHPGYGFLAENPALALACERAGIAFVGPSAAAIEMMGDKIRAKQTVAGFGVPVVPGRDVPGLDDAQLGEAARAIGFPVLIKPSAGGGGKGMRLVRHEDELVDQLASARREAQVSFGDDTLLVERFVTRPRHLEIQVLADSHGAVVHLGERECSLQRRHQKIIEEAPSPALSAETRAAMGAAAIAAARSCGYTNAGTVEFIASADDPSEFFFMEMNTRLQVEHPVTEQVYGLDLVELQLRIASGEALPFTQEELVPRGHAIEARIYAEDPSRGFLPTGGTVLGLSEPTGPGIRVDSSLREGLEVGSDYDPMLAKVIATGRDRTEARQRLDRALAETRVLGVTTNLGFLRDLLTDPQVRAGALDTELVERRLASHPPAPTPDAALVAAVLAGSVAPAADDPWHTRTAWRLGGAATVVRRIEAAGRGEVELRITAVGDGWCVGVGDARDVHATTSLGNGRLQLTLDGETADWQTHQAPGVTWVADRNGSWAVSSLAPRPIRGRNRTGDSGVVRAPMPGRLTVLRVSVGDRVEANQNLAVVEAMKMEHALTAPVTGTVAVVHLAVGAQVAINEPVVTIEPDAAVDGGAAEGATS